MRTTGAGGLDLTSRAALLQGGDSGPAVVAGRARESLLYQLVTGAEEPRMPRKADPLPAAAVAALAAWIDAGAPYARTLRAPAARETHWAFRPLARPAPPRPGHPIDAFASTHHPPGPAADRRALIRRLRFDLTGLPPAPDEVEAFVRDRAPRAYERLVDRLLGSPQHGERWARHWLDVARYADSEGYEADADRPAAWPYRDFVIRALADDMPFDRFVRWQIAGDELAPDDPAAVAATGFLAAGPHVDPNPTDSAENKKRYRYDELDDVVSTVGQAFLGLTVGCARCHDHKYDPITSREYYGLVAAFAGAQRREVSLSAAVRARDAWLARARADERERRMAALDIPAADRALLRLPWIRNNPTQSRVYQRWDAKLRFDDQGLRAQLPADARAAWARLEAAVAAVGVAATRAPRVLTAAEDGPTPVPAFVLGRGEVRNKLGRAELAFLAAVGTVRGPGVYLQASGDPPPQAVPTPRLRTALAAWLTDVDHGAGALLARVIVNRLWHHHFGRGLVGTTNDFGSQGDAPADPALLDWLASELVRGGWRLRPLHRLIVTSATYRQAARGDASPDDPFARRPLRLDPEAVRDALLATAGVLDATMFGPPFKPAIPAEAIVTRSSDPYPGDVADGPAVWRRAVYAFTKRSVRQPLAEAFDAPDASASCGRRIPTTVPTQSLWMLDDPFVRRRAGDLADRLLLEAGNAPAAQVERAFRLAYGRPATAAERAGAVAFLGATAARRARALGPIAARKAALVDMCHALTTTNEFLHVD